MPDNNFQNPYKGCYHEEDYYKATVKIPRAVFNRLAGCRLAKGTIEVTLALLISKLIKALDERNISDIADARLYESFLGNSKLVLDPESCSRFEQDRDANRNIFVSKTGQLLAGGSISGGSTPQVAYAEAPKSDDRRRTSRLPSKEPLPSSVHPKPEGSTGRRSGGRGRSGGKTEKGEKE